MSAISRPEREIVERLDAIYDVLVDECGAHDDANTRRAFAALWPGCREWRFGGLLGFGGKVWANHGTEVRVNCYPEDMTDERLAIMARANRRLQSILDPPARPDPPAGG